MTQIIITGLAGILGLILFSCVVSFYQDIKKSVRHRLESWKAEKLKRKLWRQETEIIKSNARLLADAGRNRYGEALDFYEQFSDQQKEFNFTSRAHTPVI